jgi:hypothetical protein
MPSRPVTLYSNSKSLYYVVGGLAALGLMYLLYQGLTVTPGKGTDTSSIDRTAEDPWPQASKDLERETDAATCRRVLDQITAGLAANTKFSPLPGLSPTAEKSLREQFAGFTADDAKELQATAFTKLDPHYLAECYYLRDVAKALDVADLPPLEQAKRAFAFVCRQVYLNRWVLRVDANRVRPMGPVPPEYVLRRGWGTGLERGLAFLALVRQFGLDGCLVGPPAAEGKPGLYAPPDKATELDALNGPFWAVGVRIGPDVYLFEPWRCEPFPAPGGTGVGTLAQWKTDPKLIETWAAGGAKPWDVPAADVAAGEIYLAAPVSALAPRMKMLEEKLTGASAVRLFVDPADVRDRFVKEKAAAHPPKWWSPAPAVDSDDVFHGLATFLPPEDGSYGDARQPSRADRFRDSLLPRGVFVPAPEIKSGEAAELLSQYMYGVFAGVFLTPPTPLERLQRGYFFDTATYLTDKQREFSKVAQQVRSQELPPPVKDLIERLNGLYAELQRARTNRDAAAESAIRADLDAIWAKRELIGLLTLRGMAEPAEAEATYLLALCKHEAADRASGRADRAAAAVRAAGADPKSDPSKVQAIRDRADTARSDAAAAWREAVTWWQQYQTVKRALQGAFPGRADHAAALTAEATKRAGGN